VQKDRGLCKIHNATLMAKNSN